MWQLNKGISNFNKKIYNLSGYRLMLLKYEFILYLEDIVI
jgi:hypothetical protein